jgi:hypothetical protein
VKAPVNQAKLFHHQRMQQPGEVRAGRHADAGEWLFDGASAPDARAAFQHQDALAGASEVSSAGEAVMTRADDDGVPWTGSELGKRRREADLA